MLMKNSRPRTFAAVLLAFFLAIAGRAQTNLTGTIKDVQHVVILMQENRSFDSYFGTLRGVRGFNDPNILQFQNGCSDLFQPAGGNSFDLPILTTNTCIGDVDHGEEGGLEARNDGWWNDWLPPKGPETMAYYNSTNLPFYHSLADAYTICDNNFCAFTGPTFPNRIFLFTGTIDPDGVAGGPAVDNSVPTNGYSWTTYPERLQAAGVSWRVYRPFGDSFGDALQWFSQYMNAGPGNPLYDRGIAPVNDVIAHFAADVTNGTLPQVSWIIPDNLGLTEHPPYDIKWGEWYVGQILSALAANPKVAESTVFILTYDENGGFFDHIPPPLPNPGTPGEYTEGSAIGLGIRVPMFIVSPWSRGGRVCSQVFDHTSIIRFLETWTGVQETNISAWRRQTCGDLTSSLDFAHPDFSPVDLSEVPPPNGDNYSVATPPAVQFLPVQEPGVRTACPLPYQPDATCRVGPGNRVSLAMTNSGSASVHFAVYPNAFRTDEPWQYDVPANGSASDTYAIPARADGGYDFTCYGPNGFQRRFAGNAAQDAGQINVFSRINPAFGIGLRLANTSTNTVNFTITDNLNGGAASTYTMPTDSFTNAPFPVLAGNNGWYDLTVTADADSSFVRHLAGHVENGAFSTTELPAIVGNPLQITTNPPAPVVITTTTASGSSASTTNAAPSGDPDGPDTKSGPVINSINDLISYFISQNAAPATNAAPPIVTIESFGTNCALFYPGWATNYVVESTTQLTPAVWSPAGASATIISNWTVVVLPQTNTSQFFRLHQ